MDSKNISRTQFNARSPNAAERLSSSQKFRKPSGKTGKTFTFTVFPAIVISFTIRKNFRPRKSCELIGQTRLNSHASIEGAILVRNRDWRGASNLLRALHDRDERHGRLGRSRATSRQSRTHRLLPRELVRQSSSLHQQSWRLHSADLDRNPHSISSSFSHTVRNSRCRQRLVIIFAAACKSLASFGDGLLLVESRGNSHFRLSRQYRHGDGVFCFALDLAGHQGTSAGQRLCVRSQFLG